MAKNVNQKHQKNLSTTELFAVSITNKVGTFSCVVFFTILSLVSLPSVVASGSIILWVSWTTQSFLQLVLLPLLMIGQNLAQRHSELRAEEDFMVNLKAEAEIELVHKKLDILLKKK